MESWVHSLFIGEFCKCAAYFRSSILLIYTCSCMNVSCDCATAECVTLKNIS